MAMNVVSLRVKLLNDKTCNTHWGHEDSVNYKKSINFYKGSNILLMSTILVILDVAMLYVKLSAARRDTS